MRLAAWVADGVFTEGWIYADCWAMAVCGAVCGAVRMEWRAGIYVGGYGECSMRGRLALQKCFLRDGNLMSWKARVERHARHSTGMRM